MAAKSKTTKDIMAWFKLHTAAFMDETMGLSDTHIAIYVKLMISYWSRGNKLPEIDGSMKRRVGATTIDGEKALVEVLDEFFPKDAEGNHCHVELDRQLSGVKEFSAAQSARASLPRKRTQITPNELDDSFDQF